MVKKVTNGLVLFLVLAGSAFGQSGAIKEGLILLNQAKYKEAVEHFLKATNEFPKTAEVRYWLAFSLFKNNQPDVALEEAKTVFAAKPKFKENRKLLMDIYIKKEKFAEALPEAEFLTKEVPKELSYRTSLAEVYIGLNQFEKASTILEELNVKKPNDNLILTLLGDVYAKQRVNARAIDFYNKALGVNSSAIETKNKLAKLYFREQQYSEALKQYLEIVQLDSNHGDGNLYAGYIYFNAGKSNVQEYGKAIFYLQKYIRLMPGDYQGYFFLAKSWHALRSWQNAVANFETAMQKDDSAKVKEEAKKLLGESYAGLGGSLKRGGDNPGAIGAYVKAVELNPDLYPLFQEIGSIYYAEKNYTEAAKYFEKRLAISPNDSLAVTPWFLLGVSQYYGSKTHADSFKATEAIRKSLELKPNINNFITLGSMLRSVDSLTLARKALEMAVNTDSTNTKANSELGILIYNTPKSNLDEAITAFNRAIRWDTAGTNKTAYYFLAITYVRAKKMPSAKEAFKKYVEVDPTGPYAKSASDNIKKIK